MSRRPARSQAFDGGALRRRREPRRLAVDLRVLVGEDPATARVVIPRRLASVLWRSWREPLGAIGIDARTFRAITAQDGREAWLWVLGDRSWEQLLDGLVGRVERRGGSR